MSLYELLRLAFSRLRTSRLRAALTMLGVIIGVASVVALVGVGQGTTSNITNRLSSLGTNLLTVSPTGGGASSGTLTLEDSDAIGKLTSVAGVAPEVSTSLLVKAGTKSTTTTIVGTTPAYPTVRAYDVWQGTFLTDVSVDRDLRVAVLGATTATDLGLGAADVGTDISIGGIPFRVIGILQAKGGSGFQDPDDQVMVPVGAVQKYFVGGDTVRTIGVSVAQADQMTATTAELTALLRDRHDLAASDDADFSVFNQTQLLAAASSITATLTLLLGGIASISLVVGGIGIMNIMLVSVRERTREIGIRKAIGARGRDILAQFLVEALTLSLLGGLIGIAVGLGRLGRDRSAGRLGLLIQPGHRRGGRPLQSRGRDRVRRLAGTAGRSSRPHQRTALRITKEIPSCPTIPPSPRRSSRSPGRRPATPADAAHDPAPAVRSSPCDPRSRRRVARRPAGGSTSSLAWPPRSPSVASRSPSGGARPRSQRAGSARASATAVATSRAAASIRTRRLRRVVAVSARASSGRAAWPSRAPSSRSPATP